MIIKIIVNYTIIKLKVKGTMNLHKGFNYFIIILICIINIKIIFKLYYNLII